MIRKHYGFMAGSLMLLTLPNINAQAQTGNRSVVSRVTSATEAASIEGTVVDAATNKPIAGAGVLAKNQAGNVIAQQRSGLNGAYRLSLPDSKQAYLTITSADGYEVREEQIAFTTSRSTQLSNKIMKLYRIGTKPQVQQSTAIVEPKASPVSTSTVGSATPLPEAVVTAPPTRLTTVSGSSAPRLTPPKTLDAKVVYAPPILVTTPGKTTQLRAIQFVQSKTELLPEAQPALEQLAAFLKNNPTTEIELSGHTDNQGDFDENVRLSKQRVDVVKAYLVANGIAASRITTRGYGPTRPIASNNAESTRQLNRRVEMTVLKQ
ncbi:MAG TPA: OmpA family protein [Spirosoma sp.]|nr:OmpA family protein [Spirosoma sp.]